MGPPVRRGPGVNNAAEASREVHLVDISGEDETNVALGENDGEEKADGVRA